MTRDNIVNAIETNHPFVITMADGRRFEVPHRDYIAFTRKYTAVIVSGENERTHVLPLLMISGLEMAEEAGFVDSQ